MGLIRYFNVVNIVKNKKLLIFFEIQPLDILLQITSYYA